MEYPFLRRRDRGSDKGRAEIVLCEEYGYGNAQVVATSVVEKLRLTVTKRIDGPDAWIWNVQGESGSFMIGYSDFPPETSLWADTPESDRIAEQLFHVLVNRVELIG